MNHTFLNLKGTFLLPFLLCVPGSAFASPTSLPVHGFVTDRDGNAIDGELPVHFNLYRDCEDETPAYEEDQSILFDVGFYGTDLQVPSELIIDSDGLCLGLQIDGDSEMEPRLEYFANPYAILAQEARISEVSRSTLNIEEEGLVRMAGSGLTVDGDGSISIDTGEAQTWSASQTYSGQVIASGVPSSTGSENASLRINPDVPPGVVNRQLLAIQEGDADRLTVDTEGDTVISGTLTVTGGIIGLDGGGDITGVAAGGALTGGGGSGDVTITFDLGTSRIWTGTHTFQNNIQFNFEGTENVLLTSDLGAAVPLVDIRGVPSTVDANTVGMVISQSNSANSNGLDVGLRIDNLDADLALTTGLLVRGTAAVTTAVDLSDPEIATAINLGANDIVVNDGVNKTISAAELALLDGQTTFGAGDITGVAAGTGMTGGGGSGDVTLNVDTGTDPNKVVQLNGSAQLPAVSGVNLTNLNASNLTSGTIPDARLSGNVSTLGGSIDSNEITDSTIVSADVQDSSLTTDDIALNTILEGDIASNAVTSLEIAADAVGTSEIATDGVGSDEIAANAVGSSEIADNSVMPEDLGGILGFADGDFIDLRLVLHNDNASQGLRLPNVGATPVDPADSNEGYIAWNETGNQLLVNDGTTWTMIGNPFGVSIDSAEIVDSTVTADDLGTNSVTSDEIAPDAVGPSEIANVTRDISIPLLAFSECQNDGGGPINFIEGVDTVPDFINNATDGLGFVLRFDNTVGSEDQNSEVCSQILVPADYASGGSFVIRALKDAHTGASEDILCGVSVNGAALESNGSILTTGSASTLYTCTPTITSISPGSSLAFFFSIASSGTMNDRVDFAAVAFRYTAAQ